MAKSKSFIAECKEFFFDKPYKKSPLRPTIWVLKSFLGLLYYEIFEPDFYIGSFASKVVPIFIWIGPPVYLLGTIFLDKKILKGKR